MNMTIHEGMRVKLIRPEHWLAGSPPVGSVGTVHMRGTGAYYPAEIVWDEYRGNGVSYFMLAWLDLPDFLERVETQKS